MSTRSKPKEIKSHFSNYYADKATLEIKILKQQKENPYYRHYLGRIEHVDSAPTQGLVLLKIAKKGSSILPDINDKLLTSEKLIKIKPPTNPGAFNFQDFANRKGIYFQMTLSSDQFIKTKRAIGTIRSKALLMRSRIISLIKKQGFSENSLMVIEALLLGYKNDLTAEVRDDYKDAGAMHILAISGLHIGILMMLLNGVLSPLVRFRHGKFVRTIVLLLFLWSFAFISGLSASVIRAVSMFSILSLATLSNRSSKTGHYLFIAAFISLLINPLYVFDLGFQLSYMAVLSIIYAGPKIRKLWNPKNKLLEYCWDIVAISMAAQLGLLPLTLYYFHHFSAVFLLSSIVLIPVLGMLLGGGYLLIVLVLFKYVPRIYVRIYGYLIELMNRVVSSIGDMELFIFRDVYFNLFLLIMGYVTVYIVFKCFSIVSFSRIINMILCFLIITTCLLVQDNVFRSSSNFVVFHNYRKSLLAFRYGRKETVYSNTKRENSDTEYSLRNYNRLFVRVQEPRFHRIKHFYRFHDKRILLIDDGLIDTDFSFDPDILILVSSPKLNFQRFLEKVSPSLVVADGSNYPSAKALWKKTCDNSGIAFHDTAVDGALILTKEN